MQSIQNFIATSDYPFDMIVYYATAEMTSNGSTQQEISFKHNLPFRPLCFGVWGDTADFNNNTGTLGSGSMFLAFLCSVDDEKVYIQRYEYTPHSGDKFYFKIYGYAPTTWTGDCKPTAQSTGPLLLDTDKEYAPLLAAGVVKPYNLNAPTENTNYSYTIGKDGYIEIPNDAQQSSMNFYHSEFISPKVMIWLENVTTGRTGQAQVARFMSTGYPNGTLYPYTLYSNVGGGQVSVNTGMRANTAPENKTHIRIYA